MKSKLEDQIRERILNPSPREIKEILELFEVVTFSKNEFIKKPDTIREELGFLISGTVKGVFMKENGEETTFRIIQKNTFIADVISITTKQKMPIAFVCMTKATLLMCPFDKVKILLQTNLALNILMRELVTESAIEMGQKYLLFLTGNSKERYKYILKNEPEILKKFPLRLIASLIGITPTQLSRIRNERLD